MCIKCLGVLWLNRVTQRGNKAVDCSVGDLWCLYWGGACQPGYCSREASYVCCLRDLNFMYPCLIMSKLQDALFESLLSSETVKGTGVDSKLVLQLSIKFFLFLVTPDLFLMLYWLIFWVSSGLCDGSWGQWVYPFLCLHQLSYS